MIKVLLIFLLMACPLQAEPLDRIIAIVNDEPVLESDLNDMMETISQQLQQRKRNAVIPPDDIFREQVLERLILQQIQMQTANELGIRVGDDDLNAVLRQIAANNNLTLREFRNVLQNDGFDFADFRESIRKEMTIKRLQKSQVEDKIFVSDREIDNFLATQIAQGGMAENYHLLHILISVPQAASPEKIQAAQNKLAKVQSLLQNGTDFAEVAAGYSDGQNALEGGDLGWRKRGELPSLFAQVVPKMAVSEVSDAIRSGSGFHLVKLANKKTEQTKHMVKQTLASHILIKANPLVTDEETKQRLNLLRERILSGEAFSELARAHSDDTMSAVKGGSLDWVSAGDMVPEFEKNMDALDIDGVSKPFKSRFGWHLIKVHDRP